MQENTSIVCENLGKRYNRQWIFKGLSDNFMPGDAIGITGNNGSGKSTLLKILAGYERYSEGSVKFTVNGRQRDENQVYKDVALCTPYQNLYDDFTVTEHFKLHGRFKTLRVTGVAEFIEILSLAGIEQKPLRNFSSGMRQRVKLALAILSDTPFLFLDEPLTNLDKTSGRWYRDLVEKHISNRLVFVASNLQDDELFFCRRNISIHSFQ